MHRAGICAIPLLAAFSLWAAELVPGTRVQVRLGQTISSATAHSGDSWSGTLASDLVVDGKTIAKREHWQKA